MSDYWARMPNPKGRNYGYRYVRTFDTPAGVLSFDIEVHWAVSRRSSPAESPVKIHGYDAVRRGYVLDGMPKEMTPERTGRMVRPTLAMAKATAERFVREVEEGKRDAKTGRPL